MRAGVDIVQSPSAQEDGAGLRPLISYAIGRLSRATARDLEDGLSELGLTAPQSLALAILSTAGARSNAELARHALVRPQSMSGVLAALEFQLLVERPEELRRGRRQRAALTGRGAVVFAAVDQHVARVEDRMCSALDPLDREWFRRALLGSLRALGARTVLDEEQDSHALEEVAPALLVASASRPRLRTLHVLELLDRALVQRLEGNRVGDDLSLPQYTALMVLLRFESLSAAELARQASVRPQSMAEVIAELELRGLVDRNADTADKRTLGVRLTPRGRPIALAYRAGVAEIESAMYGWLPEGGYERLGRFYLSCLEAMGVGYELSGS